MCQGCFRWRGRVRARKFAATLSLFKDQVFVSLPEACSGLRKICRLPTNLMRNYAPVVLPAERSFCC